MRRWSGLLVGLGGLFGAAGVALAAYATHHAGGEVLTTAAYFLLFHAGVIVAIGHSAGSCRGLLGAATVLALGVLLFSGDLTLLSLFNLRLIPYAAPTGGFLMIGGWLWVGGCGVARMIGRDG